MDQQDGIKNRLIERLGKNRLLSQTFRNWYAGIILDIAKTEILDDLCIDAEHPHYVLQNLICGKSLAGEKNPSNKIRVDYRDTVEPCCDDEKLCTNDKDLVDYFRSLPVFNFYEYYKNLPPISSGSLFLDTGTSPRLIILQNQKAYVVVNVSSQKSYLNNYYLVKDLLNNSELNVRTIDKVGVVSSAGNCYFLSEYSGYDFESEIIENRKSNLKKELLELAIKLEKYFTDNGYFYRNLAPRNIIKGDKLLNYLIDFDHIYKFDETSEQELFTKRLSRRVWFSDLLDNSDINQIFQSQKIALDAKIKVGSFEREFFTSDNLTANEIKTLYDLVSHFECKNIYEGFPVYGHQLGRYISDFWPEKDEVDLYKYIATNRDSDTDYLRALLYLVSRLDQELLLRQKYLLNTNFDLLTIKYFEAVSLGKYKPKFLDIYQIIKSADGFAGKYQAIANLI